MAKVEQIFIFMITVFRNPKKNDMPDLKRCWGWKRSREAAEQAVIMNATDMFEQKYYDMAVIEKLPEGVARIASERWWYKADYVVMRTDHDPLVVRIPEPKEFKQTVNWWG